MVTRHAEGHPAFGVAAAREGERRGSSSDEPRLVACKTPWGGSQKVAKIAKITKTAKS